MTTQDQLAIFTQLAMTRRSLRRYTEQSLPESLLRDLLATATWAPSAHNRQPWRFVIITTNETKARLARAMGQRLRADLTADNVPETVIAKDTARSYARITGATVLICLCMTMEDMDVYSDDLRNMHEQTMAIQSTAMAGQNLLLAAHAAGLGACWMCAPLFCPEVVRNVLDLAADWNPQALITLGYPAQERQRTREPLESRLVWR